MSETGERPNPTIEQNPDSLRNATRAFFKDREARNLTIKVLGPSAVGFAGAGLALFTGNSELAAPSLLFGVAGTGGSVAYQMLDRATPIVGFFKGKNGLFGEPLPTKEDQPQTPDKK